MLRGGHRRSGRDAFILEPEALYPAQKIALYHRALPEFGTLDGKTEQSFALRRLTTCSPPIALTARTSPSARLRIHVSFLRGLSRGRTPGFEGRRGAMRAECRPAPPAWYCFEKVSADAFIRLVLIRFSSNLLLWPIHQNTLGSRPLRTWTATRPSRNRCPGSTRSHTAGNSPNLRLRRSA